MNQDQQLLASLAADPGNRMKRLIYADWLEEHGDPWAGVFRSGDFCGAMGWRPNESILSPAWSRTVNSRGQYEQVLPAAIYERLPGRLYSRTAAIAGANIAFIRAWHAGWRPVDEGLCEECATGRHSSFLAASWHDEIQNRWKLPYRCPLHIGRMQDIDGRLIWRQLFSPTGVSATLNNHRLTVQLHTHTPIPAIFKGRQTRQFTLSPGETFGLGDAVFLLEEAGE